MLEFNKAHKYFSQLKMVCSCVKKENTRYALACIVVNDKHIVATDGRRLARLDNFGIDSGRYKCVKNTKTLVILVPVTEEGNFPKYDDVIPAMPREDEKIEINHLHNDGTMNGEKKTLSVLMAKIGRDHGLCLYMDYLKDFLPCQQYYAIEKDRPVMFFADGFVGIIMPLAI